MTNKLTAIVVLQVGNHKEFKKYRNICKQEKPFLRFKKFVTDKFKDAMYINLYDKESKEFIRREMIKTRF